MHAITSFAVVAGLMTITPGLDTTLVLRTAARHSRRAAFATALGINAGVLAWAVAAAVGVSALLNASQLAFTVVKDAGAVYMLKLGITMIHHAIRPPHGDVATADSLAGVTVPPSATSCFRQGFLTNLMNPKIGAFYVALLPQFLPPEHSAAVMGAVLALVHNVEGLLWFSLIILAVDRMRDLLQRPRVQRSVDAVAGSAVVGFGLRLGLSRS